MCAELLTIEAKSMQLLLLSMKGQGKSWNKSCGVLIDDVLDNKLDKYYKLLSSIRVAIICGYM